MEDAEAGAATAAAAEGSLPPRKRLLNSLKAEGTLPNPSPNPPKAMVVSSPAAAAAAGVAPAGTAVTAGANPALGPGADSSAESCSRCGGKDNSVWRRVKKSGVYQRLCNTCTMLYTMNMFCPYCLVVYQDAGQLGDPEVWHNCVNCKRSVHVACEAKNAADVSADPNGYSCPECRKAPNGPKSEENSAATSPTLKKPRTVKTEGGGDALDGSDAQDVKPTVGTPKQNQSQAQEALNAAKNAAQQAARAAAAAKVTALAKAQAAAKAAIAAKAALDAAAQAARAEIDARAELRRNGVRLEPRGYHALATTPKLDPAEKGKEESPGDEELARQLHRAMNSSPRNSRGPRRRPDGMSPGASPSAMEMKEEPVDSLVQKQQTRSSIVKEEHDTNHGLFQQGGEAAAVDTQGFPSTYLSDGSNPFPPFDILAGFPSHEMQAGVIPGITDVAAGEAMEVDDPASAAGGEKKADVKVVKAQVMAGGEQQDLASKTDTDVSFFGAPDPKFEIPGKWNEDVKAEGGGAGEEEKQLEIGVEDYTMQEASQDVDEGKAEGVVEEEAKEPKEVPKESKEDEAAAAEGVVAEDETAASKEGGVIAVAEKSIAEEKEEELQGTQTATASEVPSDAEMINSTENDLTVVMS